MVFGTYCTCVLSYVVIQNVDVSLNNCFFVDLFISILVRKMHILFIHDKLLQQNLKSACTQFIKSTWYSSIITRYLCAGKFLSDFRKEIIAFSKCYHIKIIMKIFKKNDNQTRLFVFIKNTIIYIKCECFDLIYKANCMLIFVRNMLITSDISF